jgi:rSAM/selenodomain-associated transferase 2/rSAM/selenodomain-associated transferase 1
LFTNPFPGDLVAKSPCELIVFGRYPQVGRVKTRLIPSLGPAGAASLQKRLTEKTIAASRETVQRCDGRLVFCHDGGNGSKIAAWLNDPTVDLVQQSPGDLGKRMFEAIQLSFNHGAGRVLLIGTDIPDVTSQMLDEAFDALVTHDLVLGPSTDGGYWLVGMKEPRDIFSKMVWSRPDVLDKTLARAGQKGMTFSLLKPITDLDTAEDLKQVACLQEMTTPYLSVVIPTFNEEQRIAQTIGFAQSPDTEIIVSDAGSKDGTRDIADRMGVRIITGKKGRAVQQNRGVSVARGEVLLFLHADTKVPNNYVEHIFDSLMDRNTVLGAFQFDTDLKTPAMNRIRYWTNVRSRLLSLPYGDQGIFMRKKDFASVGGFPDVPIAEDFYLVRKMARRGRIVIAPDAAITSGRRWKQLGPLRTTMINTMIAVGCLAGVSPHRLALLYHRFKT